MDNVTINISNISNTPSSSLRSSSSQIASSVPQPTSSLPQNDYNSIRNEVYVNWLYMQQQSHLWINTESNSLEGVILRQSKGTYITAPTNLLGSELENMICSLNFMVSMTINTMLINIILKHNQGSTFIQIRPGLRVQVLPNLSYLPQCQKHQFAAFITDPGFLLVWDDQANHIIDRASKLESAMVQMIWNSLAFDEQIPKDQDRIPSAPDQVHIETVDVEQNDHLNRQVVLTQCVISSITVAITILAISAGWRNIAVEIAVNMTLIRAALILAFPVQFWLSLFFCQTVVCSAFQILGPMNQYKQNTKYFSSIPPKRIQRSHGQLPHVTIQCPVYMEGLAAVIQPTIQSIKQAISTYEMQGGSANIFINDDGMQIMSVAKARDRKEFYDQHHIGWVARPPHCPNPSGDERKFIRRGRFKKASNMNYGLWISQRIEEKLACITRSSCWTQEDENIEYCNALSEIVGEDEIQTWVDGNIRIGEYILIVDSDTRVPEDCLLDAVSEMEQSPEVAIIQYSSGVMNVTKSFFEGAITFFTNLIYTSIRLSVANGDVAPFVGHNAILRWSALQEISYQCLLDNHEKYWSEQTVSEDFDMSLRLHTAGYITRLVSYTDDNFQEGVSLTVYDELTRWGKYAYGCNELVFHPLHEWLYRGPLTKLFRNFIFSRVPLHSKITIMSYIGTYYAIGSSWVLTIMNYFIMGWYNGYYDKYYVDSWKIIVAVITVFTVCGNFALAMFRYRVEEKTLVSGYMENLKWIPVFFLFFGGISLHVSHALLSHMFGIEMTWGATSKEVEEISFFEEIPRVIRRFRGIFSFCFLSAVLMVYMALFAPYLYRITSFIAIFPLALVVSCHFLVPIVLNPNLMLFTW